MKSPEQIVAEFSEEFDYAFGASGLLIRALTHPSAAEEAGQSGADNQRLEFLGDAVVGLVITHALHEIFPEEDEGALSKMRSRLVSSQTLAALARERGVARWLRLGKGEELSDGRLKSRLLADALEAIIGAIYLDGGLDAARAFVVAIYGDRVRSRGDDASQRDHKTELQEKIQASRRARPSYITLGAEGPEHAQVFTVVVAVEGSELGVGRGRSKKEAQQQAARAAIEALTKSDTETKL